MMNVKSAILLPFFIAFIVPVCFAKDSSSPELTQEELDARITKIRMGDIIVKTTPGADVDVKQVRHEFLFGTAIPNSLAENSPSPMSDEDRKMFLKILSKNFNYAVHENALKWYVCEKERGVVDYSIADRIWEMCNELNIPMRGHCIFWAKEEFVQDWLKKLRNDELRLAINRRGNGVTKHFKGRISEFDLNNEMVHGDFFRRQLGYGIINEMAYLAKAGNPDVKLYVNDYAILDMGYNATAFMYQLDYLLANGVPIEGVGCQGHLSMSTDMPVSAAKVQRNLDKLDKYNLPIKITECLFAYHDEQVQVDELNKLFPIYFAHPNVEAILMWGFWAGDHWQPHCAMWKRDWTPRPQALAYRDLVFNKWWTQTSGKADDNGTFKTRAFYGDYIITSNGQTKKVTLSKKVKSIQVNIE